MHVNAKPNYFSVEIRGKTRWMNIESKGNKYCSNGNKHEMAYFYKLSILPASIEMQRTIWLDAKYIPTITHRESCRKQDHRQFYWSRDDFYGVEQSDTALLN